MNGNDVPHPIYPKRYWDASTIWQNWNKLTAADIPTLRTEPAFEGQNVYFYLNHPIQYVRIVGVLIDIELRGRYTILSIDDSSGACIDVKITRRDLAFGEEARYSSNTTVDNVDVHVDNIGLPSLDLDTKLVDIGAVLEVKGTMSVFRHVRQIELKRLFRITSTNAEATAWAKTAKWKKEVLSRPWVLNTGEREAIDARIRQEEKTERERARKKREWEQKYGERRKQHEEKQEAKRRRAEERYNAGALTGSHVIIAPWE